MFPYGASFTVLIAGDKSQPVFSFGWDEILLCLLLAFVLVLIALVGYFVISQPI